MERGSQFIRNPYGENREEGVATSSGVATDGHRDRSGMFVRTVGEGRKNESPNGRGEDDGKGAEVVRSGAVKRSIECVQVPSGMGRREINDAVGGSVEDEDVRTPGSQNSRRPRGIKHIKSQKTERKQNEQQERLMQSIAETMKESNRMLRGMVKRQKISQDSDRITMALQYMKDDDPNRAALIERLTMNALEDVEEDEVKIEPAELSEVRNSRRDVRRNLEEVMDEGDCEDEDG